jgi:hypothetical protein
MEWLGQEMPPWPERCPLKVRVTFGGPGGATRFAFDRGQVLGQDMHIEGPLDRLLASVLPHEITHTVFAYYFRHPLPRWADEGGAVLSEDDIERDRHDRLVRQILNTPGRKIPLRRLFTFQDYPSDVMVLYAEGFSVANYLVMNSNRQTFLAFVGLGMSSNNWDYAVKAYYRYNSVEELEEAWLAYLRSTRRQPVQLAQNTGAPGQAPGEPVHRVVVRQTVPPMLGAPVYRGQADDDRYDDPSRHGVRPGYLPDAVPAPYPPQGSLPAMASAPRSGWQPAGAAPYSQAPAVQLGPPQPVPLPPEPARGVPGGASPVGYPR